MNQKPITTGSSTSSWNLPGVPAPVARGALPPLPIGDVSDPSAVAADRDLGTTHLGIVGLRQLPEQAERRMGRCPSPPGRHALTSSSRADAKGNAVITQA